MNTHRQHIAFIAVLAVAAAAAQAQSITNGSFEEIVPGSYVNGSGDKMLDTVANAWSVASGSPDWLYAPGVSLWDTNWGVHLQHAAGNQPLSGPVGGSLTDALAAAGVLREGVSQTVTGFTPGVTYTLSFHHANAYLNPPPSPISVLGGFEVFLDDTAIAQVLSTNSVASPTFPYTTDWTASSVNFIADATGTHTFTFLTYRDAPAGQEVAYQWLDNVSLEAVPEPASLGMLALGSVALLRRRRAQT